MARVSTIRLVVVDDDDLVRTGLRLILGGAPDLEVVAEAADGRQAVEAVRRTSPDVVLMDIRMPVLDGLAATQQVLALPKPPQVIILTTVDTDEMVLEALRLGACGFLLKSTRPDRLVEAVRAVAAGEPMLSPSVTAQLIARVRDEDGDTRRRAALERMEVLTDREREVAVAIGRGWSNAEIAERLFMSVPTVKAHVSRLLTKLDVDNRTQVALLVHDAGLTAAD
ncbi:MAG TPA: response regulator transcription factor [Ornithinicoccus sp.]|nr:response regulator transcription factor [Ornithinicoccus sp.]